MTTRELINELPEALRKTTLQEYHRQIENGAKKDNNCDGDLDDEWDTYAECISILFYWEDSVQGRDFWDKINEEDISIEQANIICEQHPEWWNRIKTYDIDTPKEYMPQKGDTVVCIKSWPGRITEGHSYIVKEYDPHSKSYPDSGRLMIERDDTGKIVNFGYKEFYRLVDNTKPNVMIYDDIKYAPPAIVSSELLLLTLI